MKYYVVADVHGFYTELIDALEEKGFFDDKEPHKLIVCGDLFDRGQEALKLQDFILDLINDDKLIFIRGNHEDLVISLIRDWCNLGYLQPHHITNGTVNTVSQLTNSLNITNEQREEIRNRFIETPFYRQILPRAIDYFETEHYIFTHGWIPCFTTVLGKRAEDFRYRSDWREAGSKDWYYARWNNGMEAARQGAIEPEKTIVCGHYHTSYGHSVIEGKCTEWGNDADFSPYYAKGIIAIDACTAYSGKLNCIVIED